METKPMSKIMMGVLTMPDDMFWDDKPLTRYQHNQVRLQAAKRIRELESVLSLALEQTEEPCPPFTWVRAAEKALNAPRFSQGNRRK